MLDVHFVGDCPCDDKDIDDCDPHEPCEGDDCDLPEP
jgi:hypothetical protein